MVIVMIIVIVVVVVIVFYSRVSSCALSDALPCLYSCCRQQHDVLLSSLVFYLVPTIDNSVMRGGESHALQNNVANAQCIECLFKNPPIRCKAEYGLLSDMQKRWCLQCGQKYSAVKIPATAFRYPAVEGSLLIVLIGSLFLLV
jgi:hypothetical protein